MLVHSSKELAKLIYSERKRYKLSQVKAGAKVGLKQTTFSRFEINPENAHISTLFRILSTLDLEMRITPKSKKVKVTAHKQWAEKW
jgi:HTH-type transcriptional regulator / antitoxin HipB